MIPSGLNFRTARDERSTFNETRWYNAALMAGFCMRLSFLALIMLAACDPITEPAKNAIETSEQSMASPIDEAKEDATLALRSLADPANSGDRSANARMQEACYWVTQGASIKEAIDDTARGCLAKAAIGRNVAILKSLGCLTPNNLEKLRRGRSPIITRGFYAGKDAEVTPIVPVAAYPEFGNWLGNLEVMPITLNRRKGEKMGVREISFLTTLRLAMRRVD